MKKALSLILALALCLSLCACGGNKELEKYFGTYEQSSGLAASYADYLTIKSIIKLTRNGTGTFQDVCTKGSDYISTDTVVREGTVSWEVTDGYVIITLTGTSYLRKEAYYCVNDYYDFYHIGGNENYSRTETYELKGNKLIDVTNSVNCWDKVQ